MTLSDAAVSQACASNDSVSMFGRSVKKSTGSGWSELRSGELGVLLFMS